MQNIVNLITAFKGTLSLLVCLVMLLLVLKRIFAFGKCLPPQQLTVTEASQVSLNWTQRFRIVLSGASGKPKGDYYYDAQQLKIVKAELLLLQQGNNRIEAKYSILSGQWTQEVATNQALSQKLAESNDELKRVIAQSAISKVAREKEAGDYELLVLSLQADLVGTCNTLKNAQDSLAKEATEVTRLKEEIVGWNKTVEGLNNECRKLSEQNKALEVHLKSAECHIEVRDAKIVEIRKVFQKQANLYFQEYTYQFPHDIGHEILEVSGETSETLYDIEEAPKGQSVLQKPQECKIFKPLTREEWDNPFPSDIHPECTMVREAFEKDQKEHARKFLAQQLQNSNSHIAKLHGQEGPIERQGEGEDSEPVLVEEVTTETIVDIDLPDRQEG
ncbi:MAG: hypothetical protein G01um101418_261 [Parcubacteria group bacterium Gr01-1014_18]|nr:MAG: hypothetical protein Greene041636_228 [Parcubacteria group bacterium Greene0416_36]TSC81279.1 MAG: hypothetical protein G01um101418_261 [Parcubacteria group bacterium Gr01-1014_18]TSC99301.1 MAG: hypothetical protein Greene101420_229 [Parcubacteria group bacterium Greene1014_20]TSD06862.1 MAG: hypothetical protein Greene07142_596 [Parcubacteria group bacterium Greene0714_2]